MELSFTLFSLSSSGNFGYDTLTNLIRWLFDPRSWALIGIIASTVTFVVKKANKVMFSKIDEHIKETEIRQDKHIVKLEDTVDKIQQQFADHMQSTELTLLRIQLQIGIQTNTLTRREVLLLYDEYSAKGGNSYITRIVDNYIKELEDEK